MKNKFNILLILLFMLFAAGCGKTEKAEISSPDGNIRFSVFMDPESLNRASVRFTIDKGDKNIIMPSSLQIISPSVDTKDVFSVIKIRKAESRQKWVNNFGALKEVPDNYNGAKIFLQSKKIKINLICRVYNEGVAFAYEFPEQDGMDSVLIRDENIYFHFAADYKSWSASRAQAAYSKVPLSKIEKGCERPLVIEYDTATAIAIAEAKLVDYSRMKFDPDNSEGIGIKSRLDGEVHKKLPFQSPWRVVIAGSGPGDLLEKNYILLNLNDPSALKDESWIKPGKVLREVSLTTAGALASVDFLAAHRMQYIEFDAGWYGPENNDLSDARAVNIDPARSKGPLDLEQVIKYARSKDIGVLLYVNRRALEKQLDDLLPVYSKWGISGIKFGFVQVGTQPVTAWMHDAVRKAAGYKMVVDVHDEYRPTGFSRTYPNFLTQEGIRGDEESPTNTHTLITMFTRALAGAADNTVCYYDNRVDAKMGSHASQLAKAVCIFSPLQFLYWYDRPVPVNRKEEYEGKPNYLGNEPELEFFDNVPTTWDETKVLYGRIGEYGIIARRKGADWFIGGINGEKARDLKIIFSFLGKGVKYHAKIYSDDASVNTRTHVRIDTIETDNSTTYLAKLGANKGIAMHIYPVEQ